MQESEAAVFRSAVMRLGFLALDRPDIQFGAKEAASGAVYPGEVGYRLGRMPTYPTKHKRHISTFRTAHLVLQQHNASACLSVFR